MHPAPGTTEIFFCNGMEGHYLNVYIPGQKQYLTLCEVKVTGEPTKNPPFAGNLNPPILYYINILYCNFVSHCLSSIIYMFWFAFLLCLK